MAAQAVFHDFRASGVNPLKEFTDIIRKTREGIYVLFCLIKCSLVLMLHLPPWFVPISEPKGISRKDKQLLNLTRILGVIE